MKTKKITIEIPDLMDETSVKEMAMVAVQRWLAGEVEKERQSAEEMIKVDLADIKSKNGIVEIQPINEPINNPI